MKVLARSGAVLLRRESALDFFETPIEGYDAACSMLLALTDRCFCETVELEIDVADVYAVTRGGRGWYVKLTIDEDLPEVIVISFHPLERPIRTAGGTVKP